MEKRTILETLELIDSKSINKLNEFLDKNKILNRENSTQVIQKDLQKSGLESGYLEFFNNPEVLVKKVKSKLELITQEEIINDYFRSLSDKEIKELNTITSYLVNQLKNQD